MHLLALTVGSIKKYKYAGIKINQQVADQLIGITSETFSNFK
jgi:hypothetical protein